MLVMLDQNKDRKRKTIAFDKPPLDPSLLFIFDDSRDWLELCKDSGIRMQEFADQGFATAELVAACITELTGANKWPYYQDVREALTQSVGTVTIETE